MSNPNSPSYINSEEMNKLQPPRIPKPMTADELIAEQTEKAWASQEPNEAVIAAETEGAWHEHDLLEHQEQLEGKLAEAHFRAHAARNETRELETQKQIDILTGLANKVAFDSWLEAQMKVKTNKLWVAFIDVDHFKQINDQFGHNVGDNVLRMIAKALSSSVRDEEDIVAHPHGDEFIMGISGGDHKRISEIAEGVLHTVNSIGVANGGRFVPIIGKAQEGVIALKLSIGFAMWDLTQSASDLLAAADKAMYQAKQGGRNQLVIASSSDLDNS